MRRQIPLAICFFLGITMAIQYFIPHRVSLVYGETIRTWYLIVFTFALVLGTGSLVRVHWSRIRRRASGWGYSIIAMGGLIFTLGVGFFGGIGQEGLFMKLYNYVQVPLEGTMFSLLAFYIASAAYRAFRARTLEATLLLLAAGIVMLGRVPLGQSIWAGFPELTEWILEVPNLAAKRGIMIGVGLGMISTAVKIILGIERSWIGGGD